MKGFLRSKLVLSLMSVILLAGAIVGSQAGTLFHAYAQNPAGQSPVAFGPFDSPSAAGEMYLQRQAGLLPSALPPGASSDAPGTLGKRPGIDVIVNQMAEDTPERTTQSETSLAVHGKTLCAGFNDSGPGAYSGLSRSRNLGARWTDLGGIGQFGDPVLAVNHETGTFYYAEIATIANRAAIGVARSTNDCRSFGAAVNASPIASGLVGTILNDKPWIAVDPRIAQRGLSHQ